MTLGELKRKKEASLWKELKPKTVDEIVAIRVEVDEYIKRLEQL